MSSKTIWAIHHIQRFELFLKYGCHEYFLTPSGSQKMIKLELKLRKRTFYHLAKRFTHVTKVIVGSNPVAVT